jgi:hypothetical protein
VRGSAYDPLPAGGLVTAVEVQIDDENSAWRAAASLLAPQNGEQAWSYSWLAPQEDGVPHSLRVRAADAVGNSKTTGWQAFVVDNLAPQLTVDQGAPAPLTTPLLSGTVSDGSGVDRVQVLVYDHLGGITTQLANVSGETWAYTPDIRSWSPGTYALRVQAVDVHGSLTQTGPYLYEHTGLPEPILTGISPQAAQAGSGPLTLSVAGRGFSASSVVRWNDQDLETTLVSDTGLTAVLPASNLAAVSTAQVTVHTPAPGGGLLKVLAFYTTYAAVGVHTQHACLWGGSPGQQRAGCGTGERGRAADRGLV